jgi:hypothetical protein
MAEMKTYWFNDVDRVPYKANSYAQEYVPNSDYAALLERHRRLVAAVKRITNHEVYKAHPGSLEYGKDARYTWPERYKWITDLLEAALAEEVDDGKT